MAKKTIYRSSVTGRLITKEKAKANPKTTERERVHVPSKRKSK